MSLKMDVIRIQNVRGIRRLELFPEGRNLIIMGENGSGKSSVIDALEYYFTSHVAQLEGRSDVNKSHSIPNINGDTPEITIAFRGVEPSAGFTIPYPRGSISPPQTLKSYLETAKKSAFVLRRAQLLRFINARDAERYQQVSQLIGLEQLDTIETQWKKERGDKEKIVQKLQNNISTVWARITDLCGTHVTTETGLIISINQLLAGAGFMPIEALDKLQERTEQLHQDRQPQNENGRLSPISALIPKLEQLRQSQETAVSQYQTLQQAAAAYWQQSQQTFDTQFEKLLDEGRKILDDQPNTETCPLCESLIDTTAVRRRLSQRLGTLQALTRTRQANEQAQTILEQTLKTLLNDDNGAWEDLKTGLTQHGFLEEAGILGEISGINHRLFALLKEPNFIVQQGHNQAITQLETGSQQIQTIIKHLSQTQEPEPPKEEPSNMELLFKLMRLDEQWQSFKSLKAELSKAQYICNQVTFVHEEIVAARKRGIENMRHDLEADIARFYGYLHPDEGLENISIPTQPNQRSSIALRAGFYDTETSHPLSYYSEGHLDSLGLCIFLAFIKQFSSDLRLILLDDVLTTVDAGHRLRVARLLAREFADYQFIITTHDQLWGKELERIIPNARLISLKRWSLEHGTSYWDNVLSDWDYYKEQANNGRSQDAIAGSGRNLEKFFFQMRRNLRLSVPAKTNSDYTIGDLYGPFFEWIKKHPIERSDWPDFNEDMVELEAELDEIWRLRNWSGAHFNEWAETVTPDEALTFVNTIRQLVSAFECSICRNLVVYNQTTRVLICPHCQPSPPTHINWEYKTDWHTTAGYLLQANNSKAKGNVALMVQKTLLGFFRDARRRFDFPVIATPNDRYELHHLYEPFFDWTPQHPRPNSEDWSRLLLEIKMQLDHYWQDNQWQSVDEEDTPRFVQTVAKLTSLFTCADCVQMLTYDAHTDQYICLQCAPEVEEIGPQSAYWFIRKS